MGSEKNQSLGQPFELLEKSCRRVPVSGETMRRVEARGILEVRSIGTARIGGNGGSVLDDGKQK